VGGVGAGRLEDAVGLCRFCFEELDGNWLIRGNVTDLDELWGGSMIRGVSFEV
jgi:hypothetical protein